MDEIDAALDFKNVSIVGNYIKERTKNAQFIVISLRSNMFELADSLVGIYKTFNCSKSVTLRLSRYYENNGIVPPTQLTSKTYASQASQKSRLPLSQHTQTNSCKKNTPTKDENAKETLLNEKKTLPTKDNNTREILLNGKETLPAKNNNVKKMSLNGKETSSAKDNNTKETSLNKEETSSTKHNNAKETPSDAEINTKKNNAKTPNGKRQKVDQLG